MLKYPKLFDIGHAGESSRVPTCLSFPGPNDFQAHRGGMLRRFLIMPLLTELGLLFGACFYKHVGPNGPFLVKKGEIAKRTQFHSKHPVLQTLTTKKFLF
jgi:hypothetical protein